MNRGALRPELSRTPRACAWTHLGPEPGRTPRACAWPPTGTSGAAGDVSFRAGASRASGDRIPVPGGVGCPRPVRGCTRPRGMSPTAQHRMGPAGGPATRERDVGCLGAVGAGLCIGKRWRAVAETAPTAGPMSKSDTKNFAGVKRAKRNRMIPRFCCSPEEREASFVSDLDTTRSAPRDLSGDAGGNSDAGDASSPSERRDPAVARRRPARVATVRTRLRH